MAVIHPPHIIVIEPDGISDITDWYYIIQWEDRDTDDNATITLYYDTDNISGGEILIGSGPVPQGEDPDGGAWDSLLWNTTFIPEGDYFIKASIYDGITAVFNYSTGPISVRHPPSINILEPDGVDDLVDMLYTIRWADWDVDDDANISLYYDDDNSGYDGTLIVSGLKEDDLVDMYIWNTSLLPEGSSWFIYANISDDSTTYSRYSIGTVTITHPPYIQLLEPDGISDIADKQYTIQWEDYDTDNNATITLYYDGDSSPGGESLISVAPQGEDPDDDGDTFIWDTTNLFEGLYFIKAVIDDSTNSIYSYSLGRLTILHNKTPSITLVSPYQDVYAYDSYLITWIDDDPDDDATITLFYDEDTLPGDEILIGIVPQGEDSTQDSYLWDLSMVDEGIYYLKAEIFDGLNQVIYDYSSGRIMVDRTPPSVPELDDLEELTSDSSLTVNGEAEPYVWVDIYHNNVLIGTVMTDQEGKFEFSPILYEGQNWFYAIAKDGAGNAGGKSSIEEIFLDTTPPVALIMYFSSDFVVQWREITLIGEGLDDSSIEEYEWYSDIDGHIGSSSQLSISFLSIGSHTINFKVKDAVGLWSEPAKLVIDVKENIAPSVDAGPDIKIMLGEKAFFSPKILDSDGPIVKYEWDFDGDGIYDWNSTHSGNVFFEYEENRTYKPSIKVTDIDGNQSSDSLTVTVLEIIESEDDTKDEDKSEDDFNILPLLLILIIILLLINAILQILSFRKMRSLISQTSQEMEKKEEASEEEKPEEESREPEVQEDEKSSKTGDTNLAQDEETFSRPEETSSAQEEEIPSPIEKTQENESSPSPGNTENL